MFRQFTENKILNHQLRRGYKDFSQQTSFHGFSELYQTKSLIWRVIWIVVLTSAAGVTIYQVYRATLLYIEQTTNTNIESVEESDILYPPFQLCYVQWVFWVDWKKVKLYHSEEGVKYSLRYLNPVFFNDSFDLDDAKKKFEAIMKKYNFTHLLDFYKSIARPVPIEADNNLTAYFDDVKLAFNDPYILFCYQISQKNMKKYFSKNIKNKIISFKNIDEVYSTDSIRNLVTEREYNKYMLDWGNATTTYTFLNDSNVNLTSFSAPQRLCLFNNVAKGLDLLSENDAYIIDVKVLAFSFLNRPDNVCMEGQRDYNTMNSTCQSLCNARYNKQTCSCLYLDEAMLLGQYDHDLICYKDIVFLSNGTKLSKESLNAMPRRVHDCVSDSKLQDELQQCTDSCIPACEIWKYEKMVSIRSVSPALSQYGTSDYSRIYVHYPAGKDILITRVVDAQSWEAFIGNVGGLLGIWTGASIVSLLQLVYLCCFTECEDPKWMKPNWKPKKIFSAKIAPAKNNQPKQIDQTFVISSRSGGDNGT